MSSSIWSRMHYALFQRQYFDGWMWGSFAVLEGCFLGLLAVVALNRELTARSVIGLGIALVLVVSGVGIFARRAWAWLTAAAFYVGLAVLVASLRSYVPAVFHLLWAGVYWDGYRSCAGQRRAAHVS